MLEEKGGFYLLPDNIHAASKYVDPKKFPEKGPHTLKEKGSFTIHDPIHKDINILTFDRY